MRKRRRVGRWWWWWGRLDEERVCVVRGMMRDIMRMRTMMMVTHTYTGSRNGVKGSCGQLVTIT